MIIKNSDKLTLQQMIDRGMEEEVKEIYWLRKTKPEKLQYQDYNGNWCGCIGNGCPSNGNIYRTKPKMCKLAGIEFPIPVTKPLTAGTTYHFVGGSGKVYSHTWTGCGIDYKRLQFQVVHLDSDAAEQQAEAMRKAISIAISHAE